MMDSEDRYGKTEAPDGAVWIVRYQQDGTAEVVGGYVRDPRSGVWYGNAACPDEKLRNVLREPGQDARDVRYVRGEPPVCYPPGFRTR